MKKLSVIFIILLSFCSISKAYAGTVTPSIVVDGGAVPVGGLASGTNAKGDITCVIAGLVLKSQGIQVYTPSDSLLDPIDYIRQSLKDYANAIGITFQELCDAWLNNVKVLVDGTIALGEHNSKAIFQWLSYLVDNDSILNPSNNGSIVKVNDIDCPVIMPNETLDFMIQNNGTVVTIKNISQYEYAICCSLKQGIYRFYIFTDQTQTFDYELYYDGRYSSRQHYSGISLNGIYVYDFMSSSSVIPYVPLVPDFIDSINNLNGNFQISLALPDIDCFLGDVSNVNPSDYQPSSGNLNTINSGIDLPTLATQYGSNGTVKIKNYIDALEDVINEVENPTLKVNNDETGILESLSFVPGTVTVGQDQESNISSGQSLTDENSYPSAEESQEYLSHMQFNLVNIFPFCIPFDVANLLSKLDVTPVTPSLHTSIMLPILNTPLNIDLDLSDWDGVAEICRKMELLAFVVGLALVTRNIIRG